MRTTIALFALASVIAFLPVTATAGENAPYSPHKMSVDELIVTERFSESPVSFPWQRVSSDRVANRGRMDFELIYDVDFDTVHDAVINAYQNSEELIQLAPSALRYTQLEALHIMGHQMGSNSGRITLGHPDLQTLLTVDFEPDGARTRITVQNRVRTRTFSGFVPPRVGFEVEGSETVIPFRWN